MAGDCQRQGLMLPTRTGLPCARVVKVLGAIEYPARAMQGEQFLLDLRMMSGLRLIRSLAVSASNTSANNTILFLSTTGNFRPVKGETHPFRGN